MLSSLSKADSKDESGNCGITEMDGIILRTHSRPFRVVRYTG